MAPCKAPSSEDLVNLDRLALIPLISVSPIRAQFGNSLRPACRVVFADNDGFGFAPALSIRCARLMAWPTFGEYSAVPAGLAPT